MEELKGLENGYSLDRLQEEVGSQIKQYKKEVKRIQESDDPIMNTLGKKEYETKNIRKVFEDNIKKIESQYKAQGQEEIKELEQEAKLSHFKPSQSDQELVDNITEDFVFDLFMKTGDEKQAIVSDLSDKIGEMSATQKVALRRKLPQLMQQLKDEPRAVQRKLRSVGHSLSDIRTEEEAALELLKQDVASGGTAEYRTLLIAERANAERRKQWEGPGDTLPSTKFEVEYKSI